MRSIIVALCVFAAACSGQGLDSPASPTAMNPAAGLKAQGGTELPFSGSFTSTGSSVANCPPTCPPTTHQVTADHKGTATYLGQFTSTSLDVVDMATTASTGTFTFTAANGDQLVATTAGAQSEFIPPNIAKPRLVARLVADIVSGTGRFAGATGTFTIELVLVIDFATATHTGTGSFEGRINLHR
jgi:hypothetical protein